MAYTKNYTRTLNRYMLYLGISFFLLLFTVFMIGFAKYSYKRGYTDGLTFRKSILSNE